MKKIISALALIVLLTSAYYQKSGTTGVWTFKNNHCTPNKFKPHNETFVAFDTTIRPNPKFIIDFHQSIPTQSGVYKVIKGRPAAPDEIDIGVGYFNDGKLTFYSSTGGNGKDRVNVIIRDGKMNIRGISIEMANQTNPSDKAPLSFSITQ